MLVLLHGLHVGLVVVGTVVVLALVAAGQTRPRRRALDELRAAAASGSVAELAVRRAERLLAPSRVPTGPASRNLLVGNALMCVLAGSVHASVAPEHFREGLRFGAFFVVLSSAQYAVAALLLMRRRVRLVAFSAVMNLAAVALWALTRTVGLPFGLAQVEPVGRPDLTATLAELIAAACCVAWLVRVATQARQPAGMWSFVRASTGRG